MVLIDSSGSRGRKKGKKTHTHNIALQLLYLLLEEVAYIEFNTGNKYNASTAGCFRGTNADKVQASQN